LSLVLLEAWSQERPVLVNAASDVLVGQCKRSNGGLWYSDAYEFAAAVPLLRDKETARGLGANGKRYLDENYSWSRIHAAYEHVYDEVVALGRNANR
jgi:glycosyltransferase involved in cell wall biosynthesis